MFSTINKGEEIEVDLEIFATSIFEELKSYSYQYFPDLYKAYISYFESGYTIQRVFNLVACIISCGLEMQTWTNLNEQSSLGLYIIRNKMIDFAISSTNFPLAAELIRPNMYPTTAEDFELIYKILCKAIDVDDLNAANKILIRLEYYEIRDKLNNYLKSDPAKLSPKITIEEQNNLIEAHIKIFEKVIEVFLWETAGFDLDSINEFKFLRRISYYFQCNKNLLSLMLINGNINAMLLIERLFNIINRLLSADLLSENSTEDLCKLITLGELNKPRNSSEIILNLAKITNVSTTIVKDCLFNLKKKES